MEKDELKCVIIGALPEPYNVGFEEGQEEPNVVQESWADVYETKAEAFYAGFNKCLERCRGAIQNVQM